jgi:hypothetical protein
MKYRLEMLELCLEAILTLTDRNPTSEKIVASFTRARSKVSVFGTDEEFVEFERLLSLIQANSGKLLSGNGINNFPRLLVANFRRELGLPRRQSELQPKD